MRLGLSLSVAVLWLVFGPTEGQAQENRSDFQLWPALSVTTPVGDGLELKADAVLQLTDDASRAGRELLRAVLLARLNDRLSVGGGYTWTHVDAGAGARFVEHRAVQEIDVRLPIRSTGIMLASRTRLEERYRRDSRGIALRLRQQTRLELPLGRSAMRAVLWNEYFHTLNETSWSGRAGPSLMFNFVGVRLPVTRKIAVEPGYLNQTYFEEGRNRVRHVASLSVAIRL